MRSKSFALLGTVLLVGAPEVRAQSAGKIELEASEAAARFIGGPIFSSDGKEIGSLLDFSIGEDGRIDKIRIGTAAPLGFGIRIVELPGNAFRVRRSIMVLDFPSSAIDTLPTVRGNAESDEK
jgi:PRC-barrel domain